MILGLKPSAVAVPAVGRGTLVAALGGLLDFAVANARCANAETACNPVHNGVNWLQVDVPAAFGDVVGVADAVTELGAAAANFANSCHTTEIS